MYDQRLLMKTLSRFSVLLPAHLNLDAAALHELTNSITAVLGVRGSGSPWPHYSATATRLSTRPLKHPPGRVVTLRCLIALDHLAFSD